MTSLIRKYWRVAPCIRSHRAGPPVVSSGGHSVPGGTQKDRGTAVPAQYRDRKSSPVRRDLVARGAAGLAHEHSGSIPLRRHVQNEDASLPLSKRRMRACLSLAFFLFRSSVTLLSTWHLRKAFDATQGSPEGRSHPSSYAKPESLFRRPHVPATSVAGL